MAVEELLPCFRKKTSTQVRLVFEEALGGREFSPCSSGGVTVRSPREGRGVGGRPTTVFRLTGSTSGSSSVGMTRGLPSSNDTDRDRRPGWGWWTAIGSCSMA
ncbi:hypothetical protein MRX96_049382 [Rhipicephalus microplus]